MNTHDNTYNNDLLVVMIVVIFMVILVVVLSRRLRTHPFKRINIVEFVRNDRTYDCSKLKCCCKNNTYKRKQTHKGAFEHLREDEQQGYEHEAAAEQRGPPGRGCVSHLPSPFSHLPFPFSLLPSPSPCPSGCHRLLSSLVWSLIFCCLLSATHLRCAARRCRQPQGGRAPAVYVCVCINVCIHIYIYIYIYICTIYIMYIYIYIYTHVLYI